MKTLSSYEITEEIQKHAKTCVYRGYRCQDQKPVIIKVLNLEYPTLKDIARLKHEYEITKNLNISGIVKSLGVEKYKNGIALILDDMGGQSLGKILQEKEFSLEAFLRIAIQLSQTLGEIHTHNIIHKDIKPQNIIINQETGEVKITDFGIASLLSKENQKISSPNLLEGTLAYMSPEQTGRMNRDVDYRTDFYSLGVTFYEMLTGNLPFEATDPMELIHCHIAKKTVRPHQLNSEISLCVSDIIMKLLSKTAEDRYQSAYGLKADLEACLIQWQTTGQIENFILGQNDLSEKFQIPQKLYGREEEISTLMSAFERVSQGSTEFLLVSGYSGIGKTALISEVHKPMVQQRGYFISGKFDQLQRNIPYASLIQAFQELIRQLLTESEEKITIWKSKLLSALGANGQIIADVLPEIELIIGKQSAVQTLPPVEAQNRFNLVFLDFVRVFTSEGTPLVIFLDDLQWADAATLKLLQLLVTDPDTQYLLMIGAYRDNEVSSYHPLMNTVNEIRKTGIAINNIWLKPLNLATTNHLLADTLHCSLEKVQPLAELVFTKTDGNPFFLNQFLKSLYEEGLLKFVPPSENKYALEPSLGQNRNQGGWQWDHLHIQEKGITDNVVDLMVNKIQKLKINTQTVLKFAACIGNKFDLKVLSIINEKSQVTTATELWKAVQEGLIIPVNDTYKLLHDYGQEAAEYLNFNDLRISYKFLHDRVQQAAYSLIPKDYRKAVHFKIGQLLLRNTAENKLEENIFDIVNQLNFSTELFTTQEERDELAHLNLRAGKKAKASTAYETALKYFKLGIELLANNKWKAQYNLTLALHTECAECEFITGEFEQAEKLFDIAFKNSKTNLEKAEICYVKLSLYEMQCKFSEGMKVGLEGLKLLGLDLVEAPSEAEILLEHEQINQKLSERKIEDLLELPNLSDPLKKMIVKVAENLLGILYQFNLNLFVLLILRTVNLSLEHGNSEFTPFLYSNYGTVLCGLFGEFESGYEFGKLALEISEKWNNLAIRSKVNHSMGTFINHWRKPLRKNKSYLNNTFNFGIEVGSSVYASYARVVSLFEMIHLGSDLDQVYEETKKSLDFFKRVKYQDGADYITLYQRMILNLQGSTQCKSNWSDDKYDEQQHVQWMQKHANKLLIHWYYITKLTVLFVFEEYQLALQMALSSEEIISTSTGLSWIPEHYFYYSLTLTALYSQSSLEDQQSYWTVLLENQEKMKKWADNCPQNFLHKYLLVAAEMARIAGNVLDAMEFYDQAIDSAVENEYTQNEALGNELAAKFYLAKGREKIAKTYLMEARYGYVKWGATAKVKELDEKYSHLLAIKPVVIESTGNQVTTTAPSTTSTIGDTVSSLDLTTVVKASQAISGEIVLSKLLKRLMEIAIENAGAQKGFLLLEREGQLSIEAEGIGKQEGVKVLQSSPNENSPNIPVAVVNYVLRTRENLVLDDASCEGIFTNEPYIIENQIKSILCIPIIHQGQLIGIFYLENNLTTGAFTTDRLEVLTLLSSQAAISIENARLYAHLQEASENLTLSKQQLEEYSRTLEQRVEERTRELQEKNDALQKALSELQLMQAQLIHSEKMSSLGQLVAGVAHEINNPVNFIYGNLTPANQYTQDLLHLLSLYQHHFPQPPAEIQAVAESIDLDFLVTDLPKLLSSMQVGAERICQIVLSLRNFSRHDEAQMKAVNLHEGLDSTLLILQHRLHRKANQLDIQVIKEYGNLPLIECYAGQLNQVFMNILSNAIDALEESFESVLRTTNSSDIASLTVLNSDLQGSIQNTKPLLHNHSTTRALTEPLHYQNSPTIQIRTELRDDSYAVIRIADNGPGMTEEVRHRLFDPFFTTKPVGQGTGMGLSISYQIIVQKHAGQLSCVSTLGQGAEFIVEIPIHQHKPCANA